MPEMGLSGLMSGEGKRDDALSAPAPLLDSTIVRHDGATSSRRRRQSSVRSSVGSRIVRRVSKSAATDPCENVLRLRRCCDPTCSIVFAICASCDRGQRYCSESCRKRMRRQQLLAAGRRYQATEPGRQAHSHRQRAYRQRQVQEPVTHQGPMLSTTTAAPQGGSLSQCAVCGHSSRWIDPFSPLPPPIRRRRLTRRSRHVQISTFFRDR
jgi:hypothetical protein